MSYLDQAEVWKTRDGRVMRLEDMEPSHRRNLQWWLRGRATALWARRNWADSISMFSFHGDDMPDGVWSAFTRAEGQGWDPDPKLAKEWLENTPLMQRLAELVADDLASRS